MKNKKGVFSFWEVLFFVLFTAVVSSVSCGYIVFNQLKGNDDKNCSKLTDNQYINEFVETYGSLLENYYETIDQKQLIGAAIEGMFNYLGDPYTNYLDESATNDLNETLKGNYTGIGVQITTNVETGEIYVVKVFDNSPASKAGLQANDVFLSINGATLENMTSEDIAQIIKYGENPKVTLIMKRGDKEIELTLERNNVVIPSVTSKTLDNGIEYIGIESFAENTGKQLKTILDKIEEKQIDKVIIDVRNNTGGYLETTVEIMEMFLEKGKVMYSIVDKNGKTIVKDSTSEKTNFDIVVLVNGSSASASEILAASLRDSYGARLVGTKTYGKGKVQQAMNLEDGTMVKYTSALWYTPNDVCVDGEGLKPDYEIEVTEIFELGDKNDIQLEKAIEVLK